MGLVLTLLVLVTLASMELGTAFSPWSSQREIASPDGRNTNTGQSDMNASCISF